MAEDVLSNSQTPHLRERQRVALEKPRSSRKRADNRTRQERKESAIMARMKRKSIWTDLNNHWELTDRLSSSLAAKHGKTISWVRNQLFQAGRVYLKRRAVSKYNAWVHCKSLEINAGEIYINVSYALT